MRDFYINPLSVNEQCHDGGQVLITVKNVVDCIKELWPAIQKKRIQLVYDRSIEQRSFIKGQNIASSLSGLPKNLELAKNWYLYTKNRAPALVQSVDVTVHAPQIPDQRMAGPILEHVVRADLDWLSFGNVPLHESPGLNVAQDGKQEYLVRNVHHPESLRKIVPRYEASDKHGLVAYTNAKGVQVSPMTLSAESAQRLLLISIYHEGSRWAVLKDPARYFCFKPTHNDLSVFHGFEVEQDEMAMNVLRQLNAD